jgi:predicted nucleotidyltransferase
MSTATAPGITGLPPTTQAALQEMTEALRAAAGDNLASVLVHGSAARGEFVEGTSDVDAIVVLKDTSLPRLDAVANALVLARNRGRIDTMILKLDEIEPSMDVFPVFYEEISERHVVVYGSDPFAGLTATDEHRRLRIEQELREAKIRTKRAAVDAMGTPRLLAAALERKVRQVRSPLRALLKMQGVAVGDRLADVLRAAASRYGSDAAPLLDVRRDPAAAHAAFRRLLDAAIEEVDRLEVRK